MTHDDPQDRLMAAVAAYLGGAVCTPGGLADVIHATAASMGLRVVEYRYENERIYLKLMPRGLPRTGGSDE